jgi:hypothetical protein
MGVNLIIAGKISALAKSYAESLSREGSRAVATDDHEGGGAGVSSTSDVVGSRATRNVVFLSRDFWPSSVHFLLLQP